MKIIIITQKEPFFIPKILTNILPYYNNHLDSIILLKPDEYKNVFSSIWYYLNFWGFYQFLKIGILFLKEKFRNSINCEDVEIIEDEDINSQHFIDNVKKVDYIISIAANKIFSKELLNAPKKMCLNIHAGLLPKYRGYNPSFWTLYHNKKKTGVTLHKMTEKLDFGKIIIQKKIMIGKKETWFSLQKKVVKNSSQILTQLLPKLIEDDLIFKEMDSREGSFFNKPAIYHGKKFRKKGKRFI